MDRKRLSRRELGLGVALAAAPAVAAQQPAVSDAERARTAQKRSIEALRKVKVPQLLEPSFAFHP